MQDTLLSEAQALKDNGNRFFVQNDYLQAIELYSKAIDLLLNESLKKNPQKPIEIPSENDTPNQHEHEENHKSENAEESDSPSCIIQQVDKDINYKDVILDSYKPLMTILMSNRAASYLNLKEYQNTIDDCTISLSLDPTFTKSLLRRAAACEALLKLQDALKGIIITNFTKTKDYEAVLAIDPSNKQAITATKTLPDRIKEQQEKEKEEMIGKLKDLGNSFLGMFGLSMDNFQFNQDPNSGGYSVNFKK